MRENSFTTRPPSRNPNGVRLNKFRKKPACASARNSGEWVRKNKPQATSEAAAPATGPAIATSASTSGVRG
ncbi:MAG: hypothetical protein WDO74_25315 [Pseudomonadota bacterium]